MASLPIGSHKKTVELIRIETNLFTLYLQGIPFHPTVEALQLHRDTGKPWIDTWFKIVVDSPQLIIESVKLFDPQHGLVEWKEGTPTYPCIYETQNYELVIEKKQPLQLSFHHESVLLRQAVLPLGESILTGILNFGNEVGLTELELRIKGEPYLRLELEIYPTKMDYKKDYQRILAEVNEQIYSLSFDFLRKTYQMTGLRETQQQSLTEFYSILRLVFDPLMQALDRIQQRPHSYLIPQSRLKFAFQVKKAGKENIRFLTKQVHRLQEDAAYGFIRAGNELYRATHLLESKKQISYDTQENRLVRWLLVRTSNKLQQLKKRWLARERKSDPLLIKQIEQMTVRLHRWLQADFVRDAGPMKQMPVSLVLQMSPGYREVYRSYLMLMKGLSIQDDLFRLSMKDVAQLYEYWCFLKLHALLSKKYRLRSQDLVSVHRNGIFVTLDRSSKAKMVYENPQNGEIFILHYNSLPETETTPTLSQRPDNVLTLKKRDAGEEKTYHYIFDAKYRLNPAYEGTLYARIYGQPGPVEDDINTMHRYRDAIVYEESGTKAYERSMFGAYVLFPYADESRYRSHRFYQSIERMNVGAFPFLPDATELVEQFLDEIISDSPEKAYERSTRPRGTKQYYKHIFAGKDMLVGSLRNAEQLALVLKHGYYHMPLINLKDDTLLTKVRYIALCQSRRFFKQTGETGIHYYGAIKQWKVVRRKEIHTPSARPGTEDQLYVVFTVDEWKKREVPIALGGQGIYTLLATSKYIFDRALEIAELRLETEEDLRQWREKRRAGKVKVKLDHTYVDLAQKVLGVENKFE